MGARDLVDEKLAKQLAREAAAHARVKAVISKSELDMLTLELRKLSVALAEAAAKHGTARRWEQHERCIMRANQALRLIDAMRLEYSSGGYIALPRRIADARKLLTKGLKLDSSVWD